MSDESHTRGAWRIEGVFESDNPVEHTTYDIRSDEKWVCRITQSSEKPIKEARANARLISAAPELLATIETVEVILRSYSDEFPETLGIVRSAIAKAKGCDA